jgi:hypothetical protein
MTISMAFGIRFFPRHRRQNNLAQSANRARDFLNQIVWGFNKGFGCSSPAAFLQNRADIAEIHRSTERINCPVQRDQSAKISRSAMRKCDARDPALLWHAKHFCLFQYTLSTAAYPIRRQLKNSLPPTRKIISVRIHFPSYALLSFRLSLIHHVADSPPKPPYIQLPLLKSHHLGIILGSGSNIRICSDDADPLQISSIASTGRILTAGHRGSYIQITMTMCSSFTHPISRDARMTN